MIYITKYEDVMASNDMMFIQTFEKVSQFDKNSYERQSHKSDIHKLRHDYKLLSPHEVSKQLQS